MIPAATLLLFGGLVALGVFAGKVALVTALAALAGLGLPSLILLRDQPDPRLLRTVQAMLFFGIVLPTVAELTLLTEPGRLLLLPVGVQHAATTFLLTVGWAVSRRRSSSQALYNLVVVGALSGPLGGLPAWLFASRGIGAPAWGLALCRGAVLGLGVFICTHPDRNRFAASALRSSRNDTSDSNTEIHPDTGDTTHG